MKEIFNIINAYDEAIKTGKKSALATVVKVEGSAYRRPGARMLVTDDGKLTGAISGGCLEGDALRKALLVMQQQKPLLATYDTTDEEDLKLGVQLGCNGIVHILIEPVDTDDKNNPVELLKIVAGKRRDAVIVTLFCLQNKKETQQGTCVLVTSDGIIKSSCKEKILSKNLLPDAQKALHEKRSFFTEYAVNTPINCFVEWIAPPVSLFIFGAGNDALPLVQMAAILGWQITVVDGRNHYASQQRFPLAKVVVANAASALSHLSFDVKTAVVLMTHNYNYDVAVLQQLLPLQLTYIGVLGPKKKLHKMIDELQDQSMKIEESELQKIYGPTGLDIGAETSEEIALSIIAEIKAVMTKRNGAPLRSKKSTIHFHE